MNTIKRAIIIAAGIGVRMQPLTNYVPKPMVKVGGVPMIESIIQALHQNGIDEIHIVVGHLKEQFSVLKDTYDVDIIENPYYDSCNNISSLYCAKEHLKDVIILDGDQIIKNPNILHKEFTYSGYSVIYKEECKNEWLLTVDDNKIVQSCSRYGGKNGYQLFSVSRWNEEDGNKLKQLLELEFDVNKDRDIYWDDVAMFKHFEDFQLGIYEMQEGDIIEIDELKDLVLIDDTYKDFL